MPYEKELDVSLFSGDFDTELGRLTVSVFSYNKGVKKLQISRTSKNEQGELKFSKLGRMTKEEVAGILPLMQEAMASL